MLERGDRPQVSALPEHVRQGKQTAAKYEPKIRALTRRNVRAVPVASQHSFEVPDDDYLTFPDPESAIEDIDEAREATLRSLNLREQALRRAKEIGLERASMEVDKEREEFLARFGSPGRE